MRDAGGQQQALRRSIRYVRGGCERSSKSTRDGGGGGGGGGLGGHEPSDSDHSARLPKLARGKVEEQGVARIWRSHPSCVFEREGEEETCGPLGEITILDAGSR